MSANPELSALQKEATKQKILEAGFNVFAENTIEKVTMNDVAEAAGIGVATVYRYYGNKTLLVQAISAWAWERYVSAVIKKEVTPEDTAAKRFGYFLDSFLDLYRHHKDILRFNQFYNIYIGQETPPDGASAPGEPVDPYGPVMGLIFRQFETIYTLAQSDGTLRTDIPIKEVLFSSLHLMLAAVTRYAVGLVYEGGQDPEKELILLKDMLLREYSR